MTFFNLTAERRGVGVSMGGPTYNPFENPSVPLSSVALDSVFGALSSTDSGQSVTVDTAICLPVVYRCIGLLSTTIAGCPLYVYGKGKKPVTVAALDPANSDTLYTQYELWELVVTHLALWGNAFIRKVRDPMGRITDLRPIYPARVKVRLDPKGNKLFEVKGINSDGTLSAATPTVLTTYEVLHVPGMGYDGLVGLSPIQIAAQTIGTAKAGDVLAAKFFANGSSLTGIINVKAPLTSQTQADTIRNRWLQKSAGTSHAGEVAVLDAETSFQPLTIPPEQLQFLESRHWSTTEIARLYGIPPHLVGDVEKSTSWGAGIEEQNVGFVAYTLSGWTNRIQQRVTREVVLTRGQVAEFDLDRLLRGDMAERYAAYAIGIQWGWMTRAEARKKENLEPISGLDVPLTPLNMASGPAMPLAGAPGAGPLVPHVPPGKGQSQDETDED